MSEKKLKQMRLPFALLSSPGSESTPKPAEKSSPKTPVMSRKRKPSSDGDVFRSNKIGRKGSKENIATEQGVVEIKNSDDELEVEEKLEIDDKVTDETTPTAESVVHIKLPSCSKSKRKINMDLKQPKSAEDETDDSIVYLDDEDLPKKSRKSAKKSERKKKKEETSSDASKAKKALKMTESIEEESEELDELIEKTEEAEEEEVMEVDEEVEKVDVSLKRKDEKIQEKDEEIEEKEEKTEEKDEKCFLKLQKLSKNQKQVADQSTKEKKISEETKTSSLKDAEPSSSDPPQIYSNFTTIPSNASSPKDPEDPEAIHDEIVEVLSDNSDNSDNTTSPADLNKTPSSLKIDLTKLTPKQLERRQEQEKRRLEKEIQRQKERDLKEQQRLKEKKDREDAKQKEKEEKEEARKKEKEEREKKRQAELDKKDEERRTKEEERKRILEQREEEKRLKEEERKRALEQRDEEKRKKEEGLKKKEQEEENRKKRAAEAFSKFFVPPKKKFEVVNIADDENSKDSAASNESIGGIRSNFMPFQVREMMKLAPCVRLEISKEQLTVLDKCLKTVKSVDGLYLKQLKGNHKPKSSGKTWPVDEKDVDDVVCIPDELDGVGENIEVDEGQMKFKHRAKFLMFTENRRPAYHGTWRKKTADITARRPLMQDKNFFDYEVDSDDEWEEEEPGESLHGSESEKEKDGAEEEYEVDNDFIVPHGHLSDEEMQQMDDEQEDNNHPETQKAKLKILQQEFAAEMKKKTEKIKPRLIGCIWMNGDEDENGCTLDKKYHCSDVIWRILKAREAWTSEDGVKMEENFEPEIVEPEEAEKPAGQKTPSNTKIQPRAKFDEKNTKELLRLVHGNMNNKKFIVREFQAYWLKNYHKEADFLEFSQKVVDERIVEVADYKTCPDEGVMFGKKCWYGKADEMQKLFGDDKPKLPNEWNYVLEKEVKEKKPKQPVAKIVEVEKKDESPPKEVEAPKPIPVVFRASSATNGSQKPNPIAVKHQPTAKPNPFAAKIPSEKASSPAAAPPKKRVQLLMSVPRGQAISETKKNSLISQFIKNGQPSTSSKMEADEDVMVID